MNLFDKICMKRQFT